MLNIEKYLEVEETVFLETGKNTLFYYLVQKLNKILKRNKSKVIHLNYFAYKEVLLDIMNDIALRAVKQYRSNYGKKSSRC